MVVEFKKGHNNSRHLDENKLDKSEAIDFIEFLQEEIDRHKKEIKHCYHRMLCSNGNIVKRTAWDSSMLGHLDDVAATQRTIDMLKTKWGIK